VEARRILLERLIDHAPMFPPARLPLPEALEDHRAARASDESWMLARFVCPAASLDAVPDGLSVSAVVDDGPVDGVEALEVRVSDANEIRAFPSVEPELYFELPLVTQCHLLVEAVAERGAFAKVRCGGEAIPTIAQVSDFILACRDNNVSFKATAGLHHALRTDREHGFLNLLAAAGSDDVEEMLETDDPERLLAVDPARARQVLRAIGSCSFWEPVDDLKALGILPL
jgi:hypothetical protein